MRNIEQNGDIQKLEEEIRKLGVPYASQGPDPLYWANFRVRVMDRISEKEKKAAWHTRIVEFFAEHVVGTSIAAAAACLLVAGIIAIEPGSHEAPEVAVVAPSQPAPPAVVAPSAPSPSANSVSGHVTDHRADFKKSDVANAQKHDLKPAEELASLAEPYAASESERAVSLESLSQPELESVLQGLETNE